MRRSYLRHWKIGSKAGLLLFVVIITCAACGQSSTRSIATSLPDPMEVVVTRVSEPPAEPRLPFYGMEFVPLEDLDTVQSLGIDMLLAEFPASDGPAEWLAYLDAAHARQLRVIPWYWPEGWRLDEATGTWIFDDHARLFLETVADHPATFAVYGMHEPYWNLCQTCGYTTAELQQLYRQIKAIADVPIYSEMESFVLYSRGAESSPATVFADGVCDYCNVNFYPFREGGIYQREQLMQALVEELELAQELAPQSRIIWTMAAFAYPQDNLRLPNAEEMVDLATLVYGAGYVGAFWYTWDFDESSYPDFLSRHPELFSSVREIYDTVVFPLQPEITHNRTLNLPLVILPPVPDRDALYPYPASSGDPLLYSHIPGSVRARLQQATSPNSGHRGAERRCVVRDAM
jgi:hypothetical protein